MTGAIVGGTGGRCGQGSAAEPLAAPTGCYETPGCVTNSACAMASGQSRWKGPVSASAATLHGLGWYVVRGIADYCDPTKNDTWHPYAALAAAAYARALLSEVRPPLRKRRPMQEAQRLPVEEACPASSTRSRG